MNEELIYYVETGKIINACINVHNALGNSFLEPVYQEALSIEFNAQGIPYEREKKLTITYRGVQLKNEYYADFLCYGRIVVELKAVAHLVAAHRAQVINYLSAINQPVGLLVNFGTASLKWERVSRFCNGR